MFGVRALLGLGAIAAGFLGLKVALDVVYVPRSEFIPLREQVQFLSVQMSEMRGDQRAMQSTLMEIRDAVVRAKESR